MFERFFRPISIVLLSYFCFPASAFAGSDNCFEQFKASICVQSYGGKQYCGPGYLTTDFYIDTLENLFEFMPPFTRKLLCSLDGFLVVDDLGDAAGQYSAETKSIELVRDNFFDETLVEDAVYGRFLNYFDENTELNFEWRAYKSTDRALLNSKFGELYWVLTHELGHHFEELMTIGSAFTCLYRNPSANPFSAPLSAEIKSILEQNAAKVPGGDAPSFYSWLNGSGFVSPYSLRDDDEDFAESFTYFVTIHSTSIQFTISQNSKVLYDTNSTAFRSGKLTKFATLDYLIDAYLAGDEAVGLKMLTCAYLDELDID